MSFILGHPPVDVTWQRVSRPRVEMSRPKQRADEAINAQGLWQPLGRSYGLNPRTMCAGSREYKRSDERGYCERTDERGALIVTVGARRDEAG